MAPEVIIAAVCASCGVLLVVGGWTLGNATAERAMRLRRSELLGTISSLKSRLQEAETKADAARAETEALRLEGDEKISQALGKEMLKADETLQDLESAQAQLFEMEAKLNVATVAADEADKELTAVRKRLEDAEKRLVDANGDEGQPAGLEDAKNTAAELAVVEAELRTVKERADKLADVEAELSKMADKLRAVEEELTKVRKQTVDGARLRTLQEQLKTAQANEKRLNAELRARDERIEALSAASGSSDEIEQLREQVASANERIIVSERVMEGVRARTKMLSQELKKAQAELAQLKG